jgi:hypothetical protein
MSFQVLAAFKEYKVSVKVTFGVEHWLTINERFEFLSDLGHE